MVMSDLHFTYDGRPCGMLRKIASEVVSIEEEWISSCEKGLATVSYQAFLKPVKEEVLRLHAIEITDSQAWMVVSQIFSKAVPDYLRDEKNDEDTERKGIVQKGIRGIAGVLDTTVGVVTAPVKTVAGAVKSTEKASSSEDQ